MAALDLAGVALAALLSENFVLVTCLGIGTRVHSFRSPIDSAPGTWYAIFDLSILFIVPPFYREVNHIPPAAPLKGPGEKDSRRTERPRAVRVDAAPAGGRPPWTPPAEPEACPRRQTAESPHRRQPR